MIKVKKNLDQDRVGLIKELINDKEFKFGLEIGCLRGEFSEQILKNWGGTLYLVDVWRSLDYEKYKDNSNHSLFDKNEIVLDCLNRMEQFDERAVMIRAYSSQAHRLFPDGSLDFIYVDANHSYESVKQDLNFWYPKIRSGGIFMGHDYLDIDWYSDPNFDENGKDKHIWSRDENPYYHGAFGVNPAVDEFFNENGYEEVRVTSEWFGTWYVEKR